MNSPAESAVSVTILMVLGCSGCSLLFDEASATGPGEPGPAADAKPQDRDAATSFCSPHSCDTSTVLLYHFNDGADSLVDECGNAALNSDAPLDAADSLPGLGDAITLAESSQAYASTINLSGSWTLDFWIRPRVQDGELLFLSESVPEELISCGFKIAKMGGSLQVFKSVDDSDSMIASAAIQSGKWNHVALRYDQTEILATDVYLIVDGEVIEAARVDACDKSTTTLILGNWIADAENNSAAAEIDELRLQDEALAAEPCAPE